jgi:RNA polymerase sigma-70 factor (subfamily 1)
MATESTTRILIERAQKGDREATAALFARAYPELMQAARFRMGPTLRARMDTLDLAQTAYIEAYRDLARYEYRGKGSFLRWLLRILENKIRRQIEFLLAKKRDVRREVELDSPDVEREGGPRAGRSPARPPAQRLVEREDRQRLEAAMDRLDERYREVLVDRYYLAMSWREIGAALGRSEEACQMLCRRALLKLKRLYGDTDGGH